MNPINILISILSFLILIIAYFIKRHIENVESEVKSSRVEIRALEQDMKWLKKMADEDKVVSRNNMAIVKSMFDKQGAKLERMNEEFISFKGTLQVHEQHLEDYGKVIRARLLGDKKD